MEWWIQSLYKDARSFLGSYLPWDMLEESFRQASIKH